MMMRYKYSEIEEEVRIVKESKCPDKNFIIYEELITKATKDDEVARSLAKKVLAKDINNMLEKISSLYQREGANFGLFLDDEADKYDKLIEWLQHIQ